jgi:hypothetical protein
VHEVRCWGGREVHGVRAIHIVDDVPSNAHVKEQSYHRTNNTLVTTHSLFGVYCTRPQTPPQLTTCSARLLSLLSTVITMGFFSSRKHSSSTQSFEPRLSFAQKSPSTTTMTERTGAKIPYNKHQPSSPVSSRPTISPAPSWTSSAPTLIATTPTHLQGMGYEQSSTYPSTPKSRFPSYNQPNSGLHGSARHHPQSSSQLTLPPLKFPASLQHSRTIKRLSSSNLPHTQTQPPTHNIIGKVIPPADTTQKI